MDQREINEILTGRRRGLIWAAEWALGKILASPYASLMRLRRWAYRRGIRKSYSVDTPVICVGNITVGGTGKTPMVAWVVERLKEAGRKPAILIRGYKAVAGKSDEAELLKRLTSVPVIINPDRVAGAREAVAGGADVLVMDDGFQHLRIRRDLDIVLIDAGIPFGEGCCLPFGLLREPLSALRDADAIVITRTDVVEADIIPPLRRHLSRLAPKASLHLAVHKPVRIIDDSGSALPPETLARRKVFVFSGIGNPDAFLATVSQLQAEVVGMLTLKDHVKYNQTMLQNMFKVADEHEAELLVTTEKDYVKLTEFSLERPVWQVAVEMQITEGQQSLVDKIHQTLQL